MGRTLIIHIRVSKQEHEKIKANARQSGFHYRSEFIRHVAIDYNPLMEAKIIEIHKALLGARLSKRERKLVSTTKFLKQET